MKKFKLSINILWIILLATVSVFADTTPRSYQEWRDESNKLITENLQKTTEKPPMQDQSKQQMDSSEVGKPLTTSTRPWKRTNPWIKSRQNPWVPQQQTDETEQQGSTSTNKQPSTQPNIFLPSGVKPKEEPAKNIYS